MDQLIKKVKEYTAGKNLSSDAVNSWLTSLITTIESQKVCWDDAEMRVSDAIAERNDLQKLVESQKEEIEKAVAETKYQVELTLGFNQMHTEISLKLSDKNAEIESLKAITELAVKGLTLARDRFSGFGRNWDCETDEHKPNTCRRCESKRFRELIDVTLNEIERLSQ